MRVLRWFFILFNFFCNHVFFNGFKKHSCWKCDCGYIKCLYNKVATTKQNKKIQLFFSVHSIRAFFPSMVNLYAIDSTPISS